MAYEKRERMKTTPLKVKHQTSPLKVSGKDMRSIL